MAEDLRQQASELYKERTQAETIPTSEGLSMRKLFYISLGVVFVCLIIVLILGRSKPHQDPVVAASTPPTIVKEAPPPELINPSNEKPAENARAASPKETPPPPVQTVLQPAQPAAPQADLSDRVLPAPRPESKSAAPKQPEPVRSPAPRKARAPSKAAAAEPPPPPPPQLPQISQEELARRELAHNIVLEKSPALAGLFLASTNKTWRAEPEGADSYRVTFEVTDSATGAPIQYIWQVNLSTRSVTPLSYYARKLW